MNRRQFFSSARREGGKLALDILDGWGEVFSAFQRAAQPKPPPPAGWIRPPNARSEEEFLQACTKCSDCVRACPHYVLRKLGHECGPRLSGTPALIPRENPCLLCDGLPCAAACPTGALAKPVPGTKARLGLAVVSAARCYMAQGQPCDYCVIACPERPRAITVGAPGRAASVAAEACTGCGRCVQICPTEAVNLVPDQSRTIEASPS